MSCRASEGSFLKQHARKRATGNRLLRQYSHGPRRTKSAHKKASMRPRNNEHVRGETDRASTVEDVIDRAKRLLRLLWSLTGQADASE